MYFSKELHRYGMQRLRLRFVFACAALVPLTMATATQAVAQQIEFEVRTPSLDDDYLTWAPASARIRQTPAPQNVDRVVVLTNDPEQPPPAGRTLPLDGNVAFDVSVAPGATASKDTLQLTLPKDGTWVDFVVAGSFPRASTEDKDAIIEVHDGVATGPILHKHAVMVRIRKDHNALTDKERTRFLNAISTLHRKLKGYERFVRIHQIAAMGKDQRPPAYFWPDLAHRGSGFLAWHRAYLLAFERELQTIDPSVTLPYWRMVVLPSVFEENFMGSNPVSGGALVDPTFAVDNPLAHWVVNGVALQRFPQDWRDQDFLNRSFFDDDKLFLPTSFFPFTRTLEGNPHNPGHNLTGPWRRRRLPGGMRGSRPRPHQPANAVIAYAQHVSVTGLGFDVACGNMPGKSKDGIDFPKCNPRVPAFHCPPAPHGVGSAPAQAVAHRCAVSAWFCIGRAS